MNDLPACDSEDKDRFRFIETVEEKFSFLRSFGFKVSRREPTLLRFESQQVFVELYREYHSNHVGLDLGRLREGDLYSLHELLTFVAPAELAHARHQASTPEMLERCLSTIAALVAKHCQPLLIGNPVVFASLEAVVAPMRASAALKAQFGTIINRADRAWEAKNLPLAMTLYNEAEPALDEHHARRLAYLRKKLTRSGA